MQEPFEHGISHTQIEELNGYTKCLRDFYNLIESMTGFSPEKRMIDSVVILDKIAATNGKNVALMDKAKQSLNDLMTTFVEKADVPQEPDIEEKEFFWKDLSGRGATGTYTLEDFMSEDAWHDQDDTNDDGETVRDWAKEAEAGDVWRNAANEITRTK